MGLGPRIIIKENGDPIFFPSSSDEAGLAIQESYRSKVTIAIGLEWDSTTEKTLC